MADIRINALPNEPAPNGADFVPIDLASTRKTTITLLTEAGRPAASQAEAEAGVNPTKAMTPLTTKQAITFQGAAAYVPLARTITAGSGLTGGGNLSADRTLQVDFAAVQPFSTKLTNIDGVSFAAGSLLLANGVNTFTSIPVGSVNQVLQIIAGLPTWTNVASGGDVTGPASSITGSIPTFSGTTGKIIQAGNPTMSDLLLALRGPMSTISNNVTDATNDIDFSAGYAFSTDATNWPMVGSALTKQLDAAWSVGNNAGGRMSAAAIANTTYHCFQIRRPDTGVVDYGFDVSATAPTLPTNYTQFRRIGALVRVGGVIKPFVQNGNLFMFKNPSTDVNVTNPGTAAVTRTLTVPLGIPVRAQLNVGYGTAAASDNPGSIYISDLSLTDLAPSGAVASSVLIYDTNAGIPAGGAQVQVMTNTSAQVRSRLQFSGAGTSFQILTNGWIDDRI